MKNLLTQPNKNSLEQLSLSSLLSTPMTRKQFLIYCATIVLVVTGISGIINTLLSPEHRIFGKRYSVQTKGYGSASYGGTKKKMS